jgi:hypothetical protein
MASSVEQVRHESNRRFSSRDVAVTLLQNVFCSCSIEGPEQATHGRIDEWIRKIGSAYTVNK